MMITRVLTHLAKNLTLILALTLTCSFMLQAQDISYTCRCKETLADGVIEFKIRAFGDVGDNFEINNAVNLYFDAALTMPIINATMIPDVNNNALFCLSGFAADGILPTADVTQDSGGTISLEMFTCRTPEVEIRPEEPDPAVVCVGSQRRFCIEDLYGSLQNITWSAPGSLVITQAAGDRCADIEYGAAGTYVIMVEGETRTGCEFSDELIIIVENLASDWELTGECELYTCSGMLDQMFTLTGSSGEQTDFKLFAQTPSGGLGTLISTTTGSGTGSGAGPTMTIDPISFPATAATYTLVACNANPNAASCDFSISKEITVRTEIEYVNISGPSCSCPDIAHLYSIENSSDYGSINWSISPGTAGVDWEISPASGVSPAVDITYLVAGTYTVSVTGTATSGPNAGCNFTSTQDVEVTDAQQDFIACNNSVNVSLNNNCELEITPDMILEGNHLCNDAYNLVITDAAGTTITGVITQDLLGQTLTVSVEQVCGDNSCWGNLTVEDKSITPLTCPTETQTPFCYEVDDFSEFSSIAGLPNFDADVTAVFRPTSNDWIVGGHDNCSDVVLMYEDTSASDDCDAIKNVIRTWTITDVSNGATSSCVSNLEVISLMSSAIDWPKNWDSALDQEIDGNCPSLDACNMSNPTELDCTVYTLDEEGNPSPDCTGRPTGLLCSNLQIIGYDDTVLPVCSSAKKILRNWTVWDECARVESKHTQIITLMNISTPVCSAPVDGAFSSGTHDCSGPITIPPPIVSGGCLPLTYTITYNYVNDVFNPSEFISTGVSSTASELTESITIDNIDFSNDSLWVRYIVVDECGNEIPTNGCIYEASLDDTQQPIPACDLNNVVALNETGCAYAGPSTFDDQSWDNCGVYQTVIQRMDQSTCVDQCSSDGECQLRQFTFMSYLGEYDGHYYYMSNERVLSQFADAYASALGEDRDGNQEGGLVSLDSADETTWLEAQIGIYTTDPYHSAQSHALYLTNTGGVGGSPGQNYEGRYIVEFETKCGWTQRESFCCNDCGNETMMMLRVIDNYGNHNFCMVNVNVEDYIPPTIECPTSTVDLDCDAVVDFNNLNYGVPTAADNCSATIEEQTGPYTDPRNNENCFTGVITKSWRAVDKSGLTSSSCTQTITFSNNDPFVRADITWPEDATITSGCSLYDLDPISLPAASQGPTWTDKACSNVVSNFDDLVFTIVDGACQKLVRTWSVVDWCNPDVIHTYDQVVILQSDSAPTVVCPSSPIYTNAGNCISNVSGLEAMLGGGDACTESLNWSYVIDYADGTSGSGNSNLADGVFAQGRHTITFTVIDACDNTGTCSTTITVTDSDPPTPYCQSSLVVPVGSDGSAEIWASDINLGSADGCGDEVVLSFAENSVVSNMTFGCTDVGANTVTMYVWDGDGNTSSCNSTIYIQDNLNVCDSPRLFASIQGLIMTEDSRMVDDVEVNLMTNTQTSAQVDMAEDGEYAFAELPMYNDYQVLAKKDNSYLNGVSTLDLILIQRHILGLQSLDSPYKVIAADINNSQRIDGLDLVELRKLILGIYLELPQNDSWRFVNTDYVFANPMNPWPYDSDYLAPNFSNDIYDADFVGVKIGDVDLSSIANQLDSNISSRSNNKYKIELSHVVTDRGNTRVQLVATESTKLYGAQMSFDFSSEQLLATVPMLMEVSDKNISWSEAENGSVRMSWDKPEGVTVSEGQVLVEFLFAGKNIDLRINDNMASEIYSEKAGVLEALDIEFIEGLQTTGEFTLDQNTPNPFKDRTTINFHLPESGTVTMIISDVNGRMIRKIEETYNAGSNQILLSSDDIQTTGVVYYQMSYGNQTTTRKMIVLK